jgi:hypothetical protein
MRFSSAFRFAAPVILSVAISTFPSELPAATPRHTNVRAGSMPVRIAGTYNLTIVNKLAQQRAELIVEEGDAGYSGFLITGGHEAALFDVQVIEETLHATVMTNLGPATVLLHLTDKSVVGSMHLQKVSLSLNGERAD